MSRCLALSLLGSTTLLAACATPMASRAPQQTVTVGIVALNDFHGNLEPPRQSVLASDGKGGTVAVPAGGAAWLASAVDAVRGQYANHLTVAAGDLISASQLSSALFLDEPTIGVMNRMGLDFSAVGNHEFDRGQDELQRMQAGGCEKFTTRQPCQIEPFSGAHFGYLAASTHRTDGSTVFPATALRHFGKGRSKVTVGLIGLTLKGTPQLVSPDGIRGLTFADEAETINALVPGLKRQGADAIVVLIHQGGRTQGPPDPNQCNALAGEIAPILDQLDPQVDVIVSGHTHAAYVCEHPSRDAARPFLLTSASFYGQMLTDITLEIDPASDRVVSKRARNVIVQSEGYASSRGTVAPTALYPAFSPRADVSTYVQRYVDASAELTRRPVGHLTAPATRGEGATAATGGTLGSLIADSQLAATTGAGAQIALMNPFGIRASLVPAADGSVTFGDIYRVQPFANPLITMTLTGAELKAVLEQGLDDDGPVQALSPSAGFTYAYMMSRPAGDRIVAIGLNGQGIDPAARYRVTVNGFLAQGGDGFTGFAGKPDTVTGPLDLDAMETWLKGDSARAVPQERRVEMLAPL